MQSSSPSAALHHVLGYLPPDLQAILLNPPSLTRPTSFLPVLRVVAPYAWWIIVLLAFYIVWTTIAGVIGYFSRFMRFAMRIGPIIGILAWVMSASGQGSMGDVFDAVKHFVGLDGGAGGNATPGLASLAGLFGLDSSTNGRQRRRAAGGTGFFGSESDPISSRTRNSKKKKRSKTAASTDGSDFLSSLFHSATGLDPSEAQVGWQDVVQDYVKTALAKASGLEWLFHDDSAAGGED